MSWQGSNNNPFGTRVLVLERAFTGGILENLRIHLRGDAYESPVDWGFRVGTTFTFEIPHLTDEIRFTHEGKDSGWIDISQHESGVTGVLLVEDFNVGTVFECGLDMFGSVRLANRRLTQIRVEITIIGGGLLHDVIIPPNADAFIPNVNGWDLPDRNDLSLWNYGEAESDGFAVKASQWDGSEWEAFSSLSSGLDFRRALVFVYREGASTVARYFSSTISHNVFKWQYFEPALPY